MPPIFGAFDGLLEGEARQRFDRLVERARRDLNGRIVWNVNSTAKGGGVAEMLRSLIGIARGAGVDMRWVVIDGGPDFFEVTKRLHNHLHGANVDGGALGDAEMTTYVDTSERNRRRLAEAVRRGDIVVLHDPQTAGLVPGMRAAGAHVLWRCHVGIDSPNAHARSAWDFLRPLVSQADILVFSRDAYVWEGLDRGRVRIIPPSIDATSPKNADIDAAAVDAVLHISGVVPGAAPAEPESVGVAARVRRRARLLEDAPLPVEAQIVAQVSRWDMLKDPFGVMDCFVDRVAPRSAAHLLLAGPDADAVADDPEGAAVFHALAERWAAMPEHVRARVHLAALPMEDSEENALIVNAIQRRADVVVQKSLAEGFGLTVAEAMWKARPVVATRVGGIQDLIEHGRDGLLVEPTDLDDCAAAILRVLGDRELAARLGAAARGRVRDHFLAPRHLGQYADLLAPLLAG